MRRKYYVVVALVVSGAFTLAACGGDNDDSMDGLSGMNSSSSTSRSASGDAAGDFNDADVTFASTMIPHHQQAVEMAELAETRAKSPEVKSLATQIKGAQDPEIRTMSGWLTAWGERVPSDTSSDMGEMDMSEGSSMPGLMSDADMRLLMNASGADFDQMFLTMMIEHHEGAIEMAKTEESDGKNADAIALAEQIDSAQTAEIATMQGLLK